MGAPEFPNPRNIYVLRWEEGHRLHGWEIYAKSCPVGQVFEISRLGARMKSGDVAAAERVLDIFGPCILRWNIANDCFDEACKVKGEHRHPIPPGRKGLEELDVQDIMSAITVWAQKITGVSTPLARPSTPNGIPTIPMEPSMAAP